MSTNGNNMFFGALQQTPSSSDTPSGIPNQRDGIYERQSFNSAPRDNVPSNAGGGLVPLDPETHGSKGRAQEAQAEVSYPLATLMTDGERNVPEGSVRFVVDGKQSITRPQSRGAMNAYTISGLNYLLYEHAQKQSAHAAETLGEDISERVESRTNNTRYITSPEQFVERVHLAGVQYQNQKIKADLNWQLQKHANLNLLSIQLKGRGRIVNLWCAKAGEKIGFLVRAFPEPSTVGTREGYIPRAPLQVVPVVATDRFGVYTMPFLGMPLADQYADDKLRTSRKRMRVTLEEQLANYEFVTQNDYALPSKSAFATEDELEERLASSACDARFLRRYTESNTVYGIDVRDNTTPANVQPRELTLAYYDTKYCGSVPVDVQNNVRKHVFMPELRHGYYIHLGTVQQSTMQMAPSPNMIRSAIFDTTNNSYEHLRSESEIYVVYGE